MRLIDADALDVKLEDIYPPPVSLREINIRALVHASLLSENIAPTIDAEPVRHGRWIEDEKAYPGPDLSNYVCSSCKRVGGTWIKCLKSENLFTYCPWCGAKMDGGENDD